MLLIRKAQMDAFGPKAVQTCRADRPQSEHWIEIELVGEDGRPIPYESYRIVLPDGREVEGRLDEDGFARFSDLPCAGICHFCFPELDAEGWQFVETASARAAAP